MGAKVRVQKPLKFLGLALLLFGVQGGGTVQALGTAADPIAQAQGVRSSRSDCPQQVARRLDALINQPQYARARWGVLVQTLDGRALYAHDSDRYFLPASAAKLFTTAAALQKLGPQFRFRTTVERLRTNPTVLRINGSGDPSLTEQQLQNLAQQLTQQGIRRVQQLIGNDGYYQGFTVDPTWEWEDIQAGYGAPINSLILNQNAVEFTLVPQAVGQPLGVEWANPVEGKLWKVNNRSQTVAAGTEEFLDVGRELDRLQVNIAGQLQAGAPPETVSVAVPNPGQRFLDTWRRILRTNGIAVQQTWLSPRSQRSGSQIVAAVDSAPLAALLRETNQNSNNLYAEALLRTLGTKFPDSAQGTDTATRGLAVVRAALTEIGVEPKSYRLADGSGLSRHHLVTPLALVQTLRAMARSPYAATYRASLAVAAQSGTLQNRFQDTPVQRIFQGKTGSMSGVAALAGYLDPPGFPPLVVSLIVNQSDLPGTALRQTLDQMVVQLARLRTC